MRLVIDRFEGNYAICQNIETKEMIDVLIKYLPQNCKEGMCLKLENGEYKEDFEVQKETEKRIEEKMKNVWRK